MSPFEGFHWYNEPAEFSIQDNEISLKTDRKTDFWQQTHYGFCKDDGHCFLKTITGDFSIVTRTQFQAISQYDQCGLFARIDQENWIKCSAELENDKLTRIGSVVTNLGYSDWASQDIITPVQSMWYRISRSGKDFLLDNSVDGINWQQMRVTHMHQLEDSIDVGIYACSPMGEGFQCTFDRIEIGPSLWSE